MGPQQPRERSPLQECVYLHMKTDGSGWEDGEDGGQGAILCLHVVEGEGASLLGRDCLGVLKLDWASILG